MTLQPVTFKKLRDRQPRLSKPYVPGVHSIRYWTKAEDAIIRKHYEKDGLGKCLELLPGRTPGSIQQRAPKLGASRKGKSAKWLPSMPKDIDERIRATWENMNPRAKGEIQAFADKLDVPKWWLNKRLVKLGLAVVQKKEPPWTKAEIALLSKVPLHDTARCSKIFREHGFSRSSMAIRVKSTRLHLSRRYTETYSATSFAKVLGIDNKAVTARCISGEIKATKRTDSARLTQQGGAPWSITRDTARDFIIEHLGELDFRKVEKFELVDILVRAGKKGKESI